jgi:pimeloyl-ACP methyl ester carboxylesterase
VVTFVLVHGSFHGGWCWKKVEPLLREAGHEVYTPTLTGLGERSHLAHPRSGLGLNVADIVQVLDHEDLQEIVLVGHSYGGLVISGVAEERADRISELVYLDGYLPDHGQSAWDITPGGKETWEQEAEESGAGWLVPPVDPVEMYNVSDPDDARWLREKMEPTPLYTHEEPLHAPHERRKELPTAYISCRQYETFHPMARKAQSEGARYHELDTGHDAMVTAPVELTDVLLDIASSTE